VSLRREDALNPDSLSRVVSQRLPRRIDFGVGASERFVDDSALARSGRGLVVADRGVRPAVEALGAKLERSGMRLRVWDGVEGEPTIDAYEEALAAAGEFEPDVVVGVGGGSVLDVAKLVAAMHGRGETIRDVFGIGRLGGRKTALVCLPTTAGTGSEASPNAILIDPADHRKKVVVSPHLVPDEAFVDPALTCTVPPDVTAGTGLDALTHCIEVFANRRAHPWTDAYALRGIELVGSHLRRAVADGEDLEARSALALASLYGGLGLGPVNTAAVHALAYPIAERYAIPHGVSNALVLAAVIEFNLPAAPDRYARIAVALGAMPGETEAETARRGVERIRNLISAVGIRQDLAGWGVQEEAVDDLARTALTVTRLLRNNPREVTLEDASALYRSLLSGSERRGEFPGPGVKGV
jgi:alcohol dehydrogenase class IV